MGHVYLSETAHPLLIHWMNQCGHTLHIIKSTGRTYPPVDSHPDLFLCSLGPNQSVFFGTPEKVGSTYPENIIYNAACTGKHLIHNLRHTDPELLRSAPFLHRIHVSQGYTKCNVVIVDEASIITSDRGIYRACSDQLNVLPIRTGYVKLSGFPYGFLGGASGRVEKTIVFNGNLENHPDCESILNFIRTRNLEIVYFTDYDLEDIGSILYHP